MGASLLAFGRMILVLGLIIVGLLVLARIGKKRQLGGHRLGGMPFGHIEVLSRRSLGQHVSLLVIRVASRTFLVGQSAQQMTMLAELEGDERAQSDSSIAVRENGLKQILTPGTALGSGGSCPGAWDAFIDRLREMTVRH